MSEESNAVFLSYASQDGKAVRRIAEALRAAGVEVWFDQNELVGGDAWDQKIRGQIAACALFVPVISANTNARGEGYFRLEWKLAVDRSHLMAHDQPFLLPVVIDDTADAAARVPPEFRAVQWTRLPGGETPPAFCARAKALLGGEGAPLSDRRADVAARLVRAHEDGRGPAAPLQKPARPWLVPAIIGAVAVAIALWQPWQAKEKPASQASPAVAAATTAPVSEARKLVAQARALFDDGDESNHETLLLAEELLKKAQGLDATDGEVWAAQAQVSRWMSIVGFDGSVARRELLKQQAERAIALAPQSIEAQVAYAGFLSEAGRGGSEEAVRLLEPWAERFPSHRGLWQSLGVAYSTAGKPEASIAAFDRANALPGGDARALAQKGAQLIWHGRYAEAEAALAQSRAIKETGRAHVFGVLLMLSWRGDLEGAAAAVERWPAWLKSEPRGAIMASQVSLWRREPEKAISVVKAIAAEAWKDTLFTGPKSVLLALAYEMANQTQAARREWENVCEVAIRQITADPTWRSASVYKACALARLGDTAVAETIFREVEQARDLRSEFWSCAAPSALLRIALGHGADVPVKFDAEQRIPRIIKSYPTPQAALRLNPVFDPIRATPEFQRWMKSAPTPEEKRENKTTATPAPAPNERSLVVLPLENLSPDPENAFFTDGMHAEIIATLQRILPELKVVSRPTAVAFTNAKLSVSDFARKIGVANVITGSVRRAGERLRVQLELRRAHDDALLWASPKPERSLKDQFDIQSEVAEEVARVLQVRERRGSWAGAQFMTRNQEAYDLFLKAGATLEKSWFVGDEDRLRQARAVVDLDPAFMPGVSHLSTTYAGLYRNARNPAERVAHAAEAKRWGEKASQMVPGGAGDGALSYYYSIVEGDYPRALAYAENLVRALPNDATGYNFLAIALSYLNRSREAESAMNRAIELNPLGLVFLRNQARLLGRHHRLDEAERAIARFFSAGGPVNDNAIADLRFWLAGKLPDSATPEIGPTNVIPARWHWRTGKFRETLAAVESDLGKVGDDSLRRHELLLLRVDSLRRLRREKEAAEAATEALLLAEQLQAVPEVGPSQKLGWLAAALARCDRFDEAIATALRWVETTPEGARPRQVWNRQIQLAEIYAQAKRPRECVELLSSLMRAPCELSVPMLKVDPAWDNVRDDPAFQALLADPKNSAPL